MLKLVTHNRSFFGLLAILLLLAVANLYWFRQDFSVLAGQLFHREDPELNRWERWAWHYERLFAMLATGERVGIQLEGWRSSGILFERTPQGVTARRVLFLRHKRPGVILTFQPATAEAFLSSVPHTDPEAIWQKMKDGLYGRQITAWNDPDIERLHKGGYLALMRAIDTRPTNLDWTSVKAILGEK